MTQPLAANDLDLVERVQSLLRRDGVAVVEEALDQRMIERARAALERGASADEARGIQVRASAYDPDDLNIRVGNLPGKDQVFRDMLELTAVKNVVAGWLGTGVRLSNFSSNTTLPGAGAMALHADQNNIPAPWPPYPCALNIGFVLDPFTDANATRYVPGSHNNDHQPAWDSSHPSAIPVSAPAGSMILMEGRVFHQTGPNTGATARAAAFAFFVRSFLAPQFEWHRGIPRDLRSELSPWLLQILGFEQSGGIAEFIPVEVAK